MTMRFFAAMLAALPFAAAAQGTGELWEITMNIPGMPAGTLSCKDGSTMVIDQQYNAARTEFKSTMTSKGGKQGDMTMSMTGRKVGACDAVAERKARDEKMDAMKKQVEAGQAQAAASMKQTTENEIKQCNVALAKMDWHG